MDDTVNKFARMLSCLDDASDDRQHLDELECLVLGNFRGMLDKINESISTFREFLDHFGDFQGHLIFCLVSFLDHKLEGFGSHLDRLADDQE